MATKYVAPTGNDTTGDGSIGNPYATIYKGILQAASGDTVSLAAGTYTHTAGYSCDSRTKTITVIGSPTMSGGFPTTIIDANNNYLEFWNCHNDFTMSNIYFKNIIAQSTGTGVFESIFDGGSGIANRYITNCVFNGVQLYNSSSTQETGALFDFYPGGNLPTYITNCLFFNLRKKAGSVESSFIKGRDQTWTMTNCTIYIDGGASALTYIIKRSNTGVLNQTIKNCIISSAASNVFQSLSGSGATTQTITYSDIYNFTSTPTLGTGTITSDPLLVDPTNGDLRLGMSSPARGTGVVI